MTIWEPKIYVQYNMDMRRTGTFLMKSPSYVTICIVDEYYT